MRKRHVKLSCCQEKKGKIIIENKVKTFKTSTASLFVQQMAVHFWWKKSYMHNSSVRRETLKAELNVSKLNCCVFSPCTNKHYKKL